MGDAMTSPNMTNRFVVPAMTSSDFAEGRILWDLFRETASWFGQVRQIHELDFSAAVNLKPYAVALVVALAKRLGVPGLAIMPPDDPMVQAHLIRLGVPAALGVDWGVAGRKPSNASLAILTERPSSDFSYGIASLLAEEIPGGLPAGITARIADSVDEVILNALAHSESPIGCVVVGQAFPGNQCIEVAIVDFGITIRGHLQRRFRHLTTDEQAIQEAVKEGITGTLPGRVNRLGDPNSGVGLSELADFAGATAGELAILSGSALVCVGVRRVTQMLIGQAFPGTLVNIRFNTNPGAISPRPKGMIYY